MKSEAVSGKMHAAGVNGGRCRPEGARRVSARALAALSAGGRRSAEPCRCRVCTPALAHEARTQNWAELGWMTGTASIRRVAAPAAKSVLFSVLKRAWVQQRLWERASIRAEGSKEENL